MTEQTARRTVRLGVIGVGQIGKHHLAAYAKIPGAQVVAVADINEAEARRVAQQYDIPHVYTNFRDLLQRGDIEAVDVALHNNLHAPVTLAAFEAGKHVYCEKPMAGSYADAAAMYAAAQQAGLKLSIQMFTPYQKEIRAARQLIDAGQLGRLYHARSVGYRRRGRPYVDGYGSQAFVQKEMAAGGALYDMGVYHIAGVLYLLGNPKALTITGQCYQEIEMDAERRARSGYNVEELGLGFVRLENRVTLDILEAWAAHLSNREGSVVLGSQGGVRLEPFGFFFSVGDVDLDGTADLEAFVGRRALMQADHDAEEGPQEHWVAALQGRVELLPTAALALNTMLISEGIYLSDRLGREVTAEEVAQASKSTAAKV
jgi:predicted dehydrogenase